MAVRPSLQRRRAQPLAGPKRNVELRGGNLQCKHLSPSLSLFQGLFSFCIAGRVFVLLMANRHRTSSITQSRHSRLYYLELRWRHGPVSETADDLVTVIPLSSLKILTVIGSLLP